MKKNWIMWSMGLLVLLAFSSCVSKKNLLYLQDMKEEFPYYISNKREAIVQSGDRLNIAVSYKTHELAVPFNKKGSYQIGANGEVSNNNSSELIDGYLVDSKGCIDFPVLGCLHVAGLTLKEISDKIKKDIINGKYIPDPLVTIDFLNFRVFMMGAVSHAGPIVVTDGKMNLLQALACAGDLDEKARINKVKVIREVNGVRTMYEVDLREKDLFESPAFNMQQNDVVYVEPRYRSRDAFDNTMRYGSIFSALATLALAFAYIFK